MSALALNLANIAPRSAPVENAPSTARRWSTYQENIFEFAVHGEGNAIVEAVAGSGKSTTIVEALARLPEHLSTVFLAFNKSIADELKARGVNARTFHSLTYSAVTRFKNTRTVDGDKLRNLVRQNLNGEDNRLYGTFIIKLVSLAKQVGIGCLVNDVQQVWLDIVTYHDLELEDQGADLGRAIDLASDLLHWSNEAASVDFDDLLYLAVKEGLSLPKFDFVFVDEAQDTNSIQRAILKKIMKPSTRMIAVGDPAQAIYGFRGSDSDSLSSIAREFFCQTLPLTVSYRCPTSVVKYVQQWVNHIEAAPGAPEGIAEMKEDWKLEDFKAHDLVVCRTTKPLIAMAYKFLRARIPAFIMGREIGQGMTALVNKLRPMNGSIEEFLENLERWETREVEKALVKSNLNKIDSIHDRADALRFLCDGLSEQENHVQGLLSLISTLFAEGVDAVKLATIHKSKGLEANRVWWLNRSACPAKWARMDWQREQETNLCYVAATRAKEVLYMINEK